MRMAASTLLLVLGSACGGDTNFTTKQADVSTQEGSGALSLDTTEIVWTGLTVGIANSTGITVESAGETNLMVYSYEVTNSDGDQFFAEDVEELELAPGSSRTLTVGVALSADEMAEGEVQIKTNDANNLDVRIPLYAYPEGYVFDTGDTAGDTGTGGDTADGGDDSGSSTDDTAD
jgi:hypothetical protein